MKPIELQLQQEAEVMASKQEREQRYARFFASEHAQAIANMGKPQKRQKPKLVPMRQTA